MASPIVSLSIFMTATAAALLYLLITQQRGEGKDAEPTRWSTWKTSHWYQRIRILPMSLLCDSLLPWFPGEIFGWKVFKSAVGKKCSAVFALSLNLNSVNDLGKFTEPCKQGLLFQRILLKHFFIQWFGSNNP